MDEGRRFLRYVTPVALMATEVGFFVYFLAPWVFHAYSRRLLTEIEGTKGIGLIVGSILGSGAIGMLLSAIHHSLTWLLRAWGIDYTDDANRLAKDFPGETLLVGGWTLASGKRTRQMRMSALSVLGALWFHYRGRLDGFEQVENRLKTFGDQLHGMGSAVVATAFAIVVSFLICATSPLTQVRYSHEAFVHAVLFWSAALATLWLMAFSYLTIQTLAKDYFVRTITAALNQSRLSSSGRSHTRGCSL